MKFNTKTCSLKYDDLDEKNRIVKAYVSAFGNEDSDRDIMIRGAFAKTIAERGPNGSKRIKHLLQHDTWRPIGRPLEMIEDEKGLFVVSEISNSTAGMDAIENYKLDLYEHSIGFRTIIDEFNENTGITLIKEVALWEYSSVTWGANDKTPLVELVKSMGKDVVLKRISDRMDRVIKAVGKWNGSDEQGELLELELAQLKTQYNDLIALQSNEPGIPTHEDNQPLIKELSQLKHSMKW